MSEILKENLKVPTCAAAMWGARIPPISRLPNPRIDVGNQLPPRPRSRKAVAYMQCIYIHIYIYMYIYTYLYIYVYDPLTSYPGTLGTPTFLIESEGSKIMGPRKMTSDSKPEN